MTPRLVLDAFHVSSVWVRGVVTLQPFTIRRWMLLEAERNPLLSFDVPVGIEDRLREVTGAATILSDGAFRNCDPEKFDELTEAVLQVIGQGFSTALQMRDPAAEEGSGDSVDLFGLSTRLLAHAIHRLRFPLCDALDTPTCQLFALVATVDALDGKVPVGRNYLSRKIHSADDGGDNGAGHKPEALDPLAPGSFVDTSLPGHEADQEPAGHKHRKSQ